MRINKYQSQIQIPQQSKMQMEPHLESQNEIFADNHSLFVEVLPITMEPVRDRDGQIVEGLFEQQGGYTVYKLFLGEFSETGNGVQRIIARLQTAEKGDILELHISSRGGVIDELIEIYNLCDTLFYGNVTTYCNHGYSAGAMAFLFGEDRCIYEHTDWMTHSWSGGFGGKRDDVLTHMVHEDKRLGDFFDTLMKPYFSKKEIAQMQKGKDFWMTPKELLQRGIATHLLVNGEIIPRDIYLEQNNLEDLKIEPKKKTKKKTKEKSKDKK